MNLILDESISTESLTKLAEAYNMIEEKGGRLDIFLSSEGGTVAAGECMLQLINTHRAVTSITVFDKVMSAAFFLFIRARCAKYITPSSTGIVHLTRWTMTLKEGGTPLEPMDEYKRIHMKKSLKRNMDFYSSLGLSEEEFKEVMDGKDLHVDSDRIRKMLKVYNEIHREST